MRATLITHFVVYAVSDSIAHVLHLSDHILHLSGMLIIGSYAGFYTISMILAGQWFKGSELATAMAAFGVFWGIGAFAGPAVSGIAMDVWDPYGLPFILVILSLVIFVLSLKSTFYGPRRV